MNLKRVAIIFVLALQVTCRPAAHSPRRYLPDTGHELLRAKILKAEDSRTDEHILELINSINENQTDMMAGLAIASGRIPSFKLWKLLAEKFGTLPHVAEELAIAARFPDTRFPITEAFRTLKSLAPTRILVETLLYLNLSDAVEYALTLGHNQETVAGNLWRSKDFINDEILRQYYSRFPEATVYSVYRLRLKGIVRSSDLLNMTPANRFYGCQVCDHPEEFLMDPDWRVRIGAVRGSNTLPAAKQLLSDPLPMVRAAAIRVYLDNQGSPDIFLAKKLTAMEAEMVCPYLRETDIIKQIYDRGDPFAEIAGPFLGREYRQTILSSGIPDRAKIQYLERQFGKENAIPYARSLFTEKDSSPALLYLLEQKENVNIQEYVSLAKAKGKFTSELQDFGYLRPEPVDLPLETYVAILKKIKKYRGFVMHTEKGSVTCHFRLPEAPMTCFNFIKLVEKKYFNGSRFHRVIPAFVSQDGDPTGTGSGGPGYSIRCEYNRLRYDRPGMVGMALAGKDTGGSQFFLTHLPTPHLNHQYTIFAAVTKGLHLLEKICQYDRIREIRLF